MSALPHYLGHLPGVGPQRAARLRQEGCACWADVAGAPAPRAGFGAAEWDGLRRAAERSLHALEADDAAYFTAALPAAEQWRVLAHWFARASYFDIETSGLEADSIVTLVCCFHEGQPLRFLADENLDDFLELLDGVKLLVSYNGASFDVPRVLARFHVPALPCAHVDLRWLCHRAGWRGGLKAIERALGLRRPADLEGMGGAEAVWLWQAWAEAGDARARRTLERYCAADTVMLKRLAAELCRIYGAPVDVPDEAELWGLVHAALPDLGRPANAWPAAVAEPAAPRPAPPVVAAADLPSIAALVGGAAPGLTRAEKQARLRARWRAFSGRAAD